MKIALFSDSHGEYHRMYLAVSEYRPQMVVHLGDYSRDAHELMQKFPRIPFRIVRGNCDFSSTDTLNDTFFCDTAKVFITHGHAYGVKNGLSRLITAGRSIGADIVMFGHTHRAHLESYGGMQLLNPGSIGDYSGARWAKVEIDEHGINCEIIRVS